MGFLRAGRIHQPFLMDTAGSPPGCDALNACRVSDCAHPPRPMDMGIFVFVVGFFSPKHGSYGIFTSEFFHFSPCSKFLSNALFQESTW